MSINIKTDLTKVWFDEEANSYRVFSPNGSELPCIVEVEINQNAEDLMIVNAEIKLLVNIVNSKP